MNNKQQCPINDYSRLFIAIIANIIVSTSIQTTLLIDNKCVDVLLDSCYNNATST